MDMPRIRRKKSPLDRVIPGRNKSLMQRTKKRLGKRRSSSSPARAVAAGVGVAAVGVSAVAAKGAGLTAKIGKAVAKRKAKRAASKPKEKLNQVA